MISYAQLSTKLEELKTKYPGYEWKARRGPAGSMLIAARPLNSPGWILWDAAWVGEDSPASQIPPGGVFGVPYRVR